MIVIRYNNKKNIVMKKIIFLLLICSCITFSKAQDTVKCNDFYYLIHHPVPPFTPQMPYGTNDTTSYLPRPYLLNAIQEYYSNNPVTVYGVAVTGKQSYNNLRVMLFDQIDKGTDSILALDSCEMKIKNRFFDYEAQYVADFVPNKTVVPCMEFYFDHPHVLMDTFYVGAKCFHDEDFNFMLYAGFDATCSQHWRIIYWPYERFLPSPMGNLTNLWGCIFPIVNLRCSIPWKPIVLNRGLHEITIGWHAGEEGLLFQVSVGACSSNPDTNEIYTLQDTSITITGLEQEKCYGLWLRQGCRYHTAGYDTVVWSPWSSARMIFLSQEDIDTPEIDENEVTLSPNPATGSAEVLSSFGVSRVEVFSAAGRKMMDLKAEGLKATLDVSKLPSGAYLLRIHTPQGMTTKKLLIR